MTGDVDVDADAHATGKVGVIGEERLQLVAGEWVVDANSRVGTGVDADDDLGATVAVDVAGGDEEARGKKLVEGEKLLIIFGLVAPAKISTVGPPPGPGTVMISARPSLSTSPAATRTPPKNSGS